MFRSIQELIIEGEQELGFVAGVDPLADRYRAGKLAGLRSLLDVEFEEMNND